MGNSLFASCNRQQILNKLAIASNLSRLMIVLMGLLALLWELKVRKGCQNISVMENSPHFIIRKRSKNLICSHF